ncbi:MAG: cbb3-type cytochrome oxidase assembly protein [Telluria sp.]
MEALDLLVLQSVMLVALTLWIFFGAADGGQFEDLEGAGIVMDEDGAQAVPARGEGPGAG